MEWWLVKEQSQEVSKLRPAGSIGGKVPGSGPRLLPIAPLYTRRSCPVLHLQLQESKAMLLQRKRLCEYVPGVEGAGDNCVWAGMETESQEGQAPIH